MEDKIKLMEEQIKALRELVSIKDQTIAELQKKPLIPQVQYVYHTYPYNYYPYNWHSGILYGQTSQVYGGTGTSGISGQLNLGATSSGMTQGANAVLSQLNQHNCAQNTGPVSNTSLFSTTY